MLASILNKITFRLHPTTRHTTNILSLFNGHRSGFIGYVTTPNGSLLKHSPFMQPETLRCDMPSDPCDPTTSPSQISKDPELKIN